MDMEAFVRDLLSDPESAIKAYREAGERDEAIEELIKQATQLENNIRDALEIPAPSGLAASILEHVEQKDSEHRAFEEALLADPDSAIATYRESGQRDEARDELVAQTTQLDRAVRNALEVPAPQNLAAGIVSHVQEKQRQLEDFEQNLLADPENTIAAYRESGESDEALDDLIAQATQLEANLRGALDAPVPSGLAAGILNHVQDADREQLVFERALMTEPAEALASVEAGDHDKQALAEDAKRFEGSLKAALSVTPPTNLAQSIIDHVQRLAHSRRPRAWVTGIAASLFAIVGVTLVLTPRSGEAAKLRTAFSEHALHEEPGAMTNFAPVQQQLVATLFSDFGAHRSQSFGPVHYARKCPIGDGHGAHIVMQQADGPVTFLFLPDKSIASAQSFDVEGGVTGRMFPMANGVGALFGHNGQSLDGLDQKITQSFTDAVAARAAAGQDVSALFGQDRQSAPKSFDEAVAALAAARDAERG